MTFCELLDVFWSPRLMVKNGCVFSLKGCIALLLEDI